MNFKKFISGVSALAIAASAFAGLAVTASAATTYTEDFSAVEDAAAWWDSVHGDLTASITEAGAMELKNNSTSGNRSASKAIEFSGAAGATIDMDVYSNRGDRGTTLTFTDGSGATLFKLAKTANSEDANWCRLEVTDAAGVTTSLGGSGVEKYHVNAVVNYDEGTVTVKTTNVYNNRNAKQADGSAELSTSASGGKINFAVEVRRGGAASVDNIVVAGTDRVITTPSYSAPNTALDVNTCVSDYAAASTEGTTYAPKKDVSDGSYVSNVDFMLDSASSVLQVYPYSSKSGSPTTNTPVNITPGKVSALGASTTNYTADGIKDGKWYRMTISIVNYAGKMNVDITDISTGSSVFNEDITVRNASSMRYRTLKITAVEGDSYVANVVIYRVGIAKLAATIGEQDTVTGTNEYSADSATYFTVTVTNNGEAEGSYNRVSVTDGTDKFTATVPSITLAASKTAEVIYGGIVEGAYNFSAASVAFVE